MRIATAWISSILVSSAFLLSVSYLTAQPLQLSLVMNPQPSPYLSDWQTRRETVLLSVTNTQQQPFVVKIHARIIQGSQTGTLLAETKVDEMPFLQIPPGTSIFNGEDVVPQDAVKFYGGVETNAVRSGRIAAGQYTLCVVLLDAELLQPLSQQRCSQFSLTQHLPPQLYNPTNQQSLTIEQLRTAVFRWSREAPPVQNAITQFVVVEHRKDQPLWQALSANPPVFQTDVPSGLTQLQWPPDVVLQHDRKYVWSVRVADDQSRSVTEPEWADPFLFTMVQGSTTPPVSCDNATLTLTFGKALGDVQTLQQHSGRSDAVEFVATDANAFPSNSLLAVVADLSCASECIREVKWTVTRITSTDQTASGESIGELTINTAALQVPDGNRQRFNQFIESAGTYRIHCKVSVLSPQDSANVSKTQIIEQTLVVTATTPPPVTEKPPCVVTIANPPNPCNGSVETSHVDPVINVTVIVSGPISEITVTIRENQCGTYTPPTIPGTPTTPTPSGGPTTTGPKDGSTPPSGGSTTPSGGPITQDRYLEKLKRKQENPSQGANTFSIAVGEVIQPGGAYVVEVTGICPNPDGTFSTISAVPTCDRYRPMSTPTTSTPSDRPPLPVPIPECPDTTFPVPCGPSYTSEPATPIEATIELENADLYKYPRASPLRANTIDWDYAVFNCTGCGGIGKEWKPTRDLADIIDWELVGKGSLNIPFDASGIKKIDEDIDALLARLAAIKDSLSAARKDRTKAIDKFKNDVEAAKKMLSEKEAQKKQLADNLMDALKRLDSAKNAVDSIAEKLDSISAYASKLRDTARITQDSVTRYDSLLTDPPSETEKSLLESVASTQKNLESTEKTLRDLQKSIATESASLQKAIKTTDSLLTVAQLAYKALQESSGVLTKKVADLQHSLYGTPALKAYRVSRRELQQQQAAFTASFYDASGAATLSTLVTTMLTETHSMLQTLDAAERARVKKLVDSLSSISKAILSTCCSIYSDTSKKSTCKGMAEELKLTIDKFKTDVGICITTKQLLSAGIEASIKKAQGDLGSKEGALKSAEASVTSAAVAHKSALESYRSRITILDGQRATALQNADKAQNDNTQAQRLYQAERERRDSMFRINQPIYLSSRGEFARRRDSALHLIDSLAIVFESSRSDSIVAAAGLRDLVADTAALGDSIRAVDADILRLKAFLKLTEKDITKPFDDLIARLLKDSADIENKLKDKKKEREDISKGNKKAAEEFVYYIPPPLEEIMKDKPRFEELKDSLAAAETRVKIALAGKEAVQGMLVRLLEGISSDLVEIKQLEFMIRNAEEEIKEIDKELGDKKNDLAKEYRESYDNIDDERVAAENEENSADDKMVKAAADGAKFTVELEQNRTDLGKALDDLALARKAVKDALDSRASRMASVQSTANIASTTGSALNNDSKDLRSAQRTQRKGKDETRRAIAKENLAAETIAKAKVNTATSAVKSKESSIDTKKKSIAALSKQLGVQFTDLVKDDTLLAKRLREFVKAEEAATSKKATYDFTFFKLEKASQQVEYWRGIRNNAEDRKNESQAALDDMPAADSVTNDDDDVQSGKERKEDLEKQVADAKKNADGVKKSIADALAEKDKLIKDADKEIEDSRKNLDKCENELRDFLVNEFNTVTHTDTLILRVKDRVVDAFRAGDPLKTIECYITYEGNRTPKVLCAPLKEAPPPGKKQAGPCIPDVAFQPLSGVTGAPPTLHKQEPRTIALVYKDGKPLWPEWPVIRESKVLAKDVTVLKGEANDNDLVIISCIPQKVGCVPGPPLTPGIKDLASRTWIKHDGTYYHLLDRSPFVLWEPDKVPQGVCSNQQKVEAEYRANEIAPDPIDKQNAKIDVEPGVLIEIPDSLIGWPKKTDTVVARIVTGDHKGLDGETIVMSVKLVEGRSEDWGLDGKKKTAERKTDGDGYVKIPFSYGDGFARFEIEVKWSRPDTCKRGKLAAVAPLLLRFHRLGKAPPTIAWNAAKKVWTGSGVDDALKGLPDVKEEDDTYEKKIHGVSGFLNENRDFVDGELMKFTPVSPKYEIDPKEEETALFGIARAEIVDEIEEGIVTMKASCEDSLRPVCRPPDSTRKYDPKGEKTFKIGSPDDLFVVEMEEGFDPSDVVAGNGTLKIDSPNEFLQSLVELPLVVDGVQLDKKLVATTGTVTWETGGLSAKVGAFTFELTKVFVIAQSSAGIEGAIKHTSIEDRPVSFTAVLGADGEFYGEASNLPEVSCAGFVLKQGASIAVDFHSSYPEKTPLGPAFKGIVIGTAELEFPEAFRVRNTDEPTVLSATDLAIGDGGVTGTLAIEGGPLTMSYAKYALSVKKLSVTFDANKLKAAEIEGAFTMDKPFTGTINATITFDDTWIAEFDTESSITIPRWKTAVAILPGTKLEYDPGKSVGTFTLVAKISSDRFGEINIDELMVSSDGKFSIKGGIGKEIDIKILNGFDLHLTGADIVASNDEFELQIHGSIGIPGIGLKSLKGSLIIKPGPDVDVKIDGGEISIKKGPFELNGKISYKENEFYAKLSVEIKNVLKGVEGEIYVGTQPLPDNTTYTYWYVGLTVSTAIPLGQSGLAITEIGGGIGWNCVPPIGSEKPTPKYVDDISLRASVGIGNSIPPPGKLFNSRFTMVYVPGSITLAGEAWLLDQHENIVGSGQITIAWDPVLLMKGDVQARLSLPDNEGKVVLMRGKIDFEFSDKVFKIESEFLDASVMGFLNANAQLLVTKKHGYLKGKVWYELEKQADIVVAVLSAEMNMTATLDLSYKTEPTISLLGDISFTGSAKLNASSGPFSWDIASASITCKATVSTIGTKFKLSGSVKAYASVLGFSGNVDYDVGFEV